MLQADRTEFDGQMRRYFGGIPGVVVTQDKLDGYFTGLVKMPLADVVRVIDFELQREVEGAPRAKAPGQFWAVLREARAARQPPAVQPQQSDWHGDAWDQASNNHLIAELWRLAVIGRSPCSAAMRANPAMRDQDQESIDLLQPYLDHKRHWAQEMREAAADGAVPADAGRGWWADRMKLAREQCDEVRTRYGLKEAA